MTARVALVLTVLVGLAVVGVRHERPRPAAAVCSTDAQCAAWERQHAVPLAARCVGAPCAASVCATQPRLYTDADGRHAHLEIDTYTQATPCPPVPID